MQDPNKSQMSNPNLSLCASFWTTVCTNPNHLAKCIELKHQYRASSLHYFYKYVFLRDQHISTQLAIHSAAASRSVLYYLENVKNISFLLSHIMCSDQMALMPWFCIPCSFVFTLHNSELLVMEYHTSLVSNNWL